MSKLIRAPQRQPDSIVIPFALFYTEHLIVNIINSTASRIEVRDGRVGVFDEIEGWIDLGDDFAFAYLDYLVNGAGLCLTHITDSK